MTSRIEMSCEIRQRIRKLEAFCAQDASPAVSSSGALSSPVAADLPAKSELLANLRTKLAQFPLNSMQCSEVLTHTLHCMFLHERRHKELEADIRERDQTIANMRSHVNYLMELAEPVSWSLKQIPRVLVAPKEKDRWLEMAEDIEEAGPMRKRGEGFQPCPELLRMRQRLLISYKECKQELDRKDKGLPSLEDEHDEAMRQYAALVKERSAVAEFLRTWNPDDVVERVPKKRKHKRKQKQEPAYEPMEEVEATEKDQPVEEETVNIPKRSDSLSGVSESFDFCDDM